MQDFNGALSLRHTHHALQTTSGILLRSWRAYMLFHSSHSFFSRRPIS